MKKKINKYKYYKEKINIEDLIEKRYKILVIIIMIIMIILLIGLFNVQILKNKYYESKLEELTVTIIEGESTPRGRIYDRNGVLIVDNVSVKTIYYKKQNNVTTNDEIKMAYLVSDYINVDYDKLTDRMLKEFWVLNNRDKAKERITEEEWNLLEVRKLTNEDIEELKLKRVTEDDLKEYDSTDKEACYIYNLMNKGYYYTEKTIKNKDVSDSEYGTIAEHLDVLPGFNVKLDWERSYPYGTVFKTILGSVSSSSSGIPYNLKEYYLEKGYSLTDRVGTSYIEYQYEDYLKGTKATYEVNDDGSYTELTKGTRGNDIVLTIDIELQKEVEKILEEELIKAKTERYTDYFDKSYVIINNPNTGEVLAMAGKQIEKKENGSYIIYDYTPGVITSSVTPGSIVKGASHIVGYNTGALKINEYRNDACIKIAATPLKCSFREYGNINDVEALKYSSNTYQFLTAINVGGGKYSYNKALVINEKAFDTYRNTFSEFGLGIKTEIDLPNESLGYQGINRLSGLLLDFSIGQYDTYTPIQISQYMSTIANNGKRMRPYLLKAVFDSSKENFSSVIYETKEKKLNVVKTDKKYIERVKEGFREVMNGGTGAGYVDYSYKAAGKTGTAQSFLDTDGDGKIDTATTTATFSAYAPYDNPEVVFTVISPDVAPEEVSYDAMSRVNMRISQKVSKKYFEIYR